MRHRVPLFRKCPARGGITIGRSHSFRIVASPAVIRRTAPRPSARRSAPSRSMPSITPSCTSSRKSTRTRFPAISDRASPFLPDRRKSRMQEGFIPPFQPLTEQKSHIFPGMHPTRLLPKRCGDVAMPRIEILPPDVHVQADPEDHRARSPGRRHFRQDAADLPAPDPDIIRPFDPHSRRTERSNRLRNRHPRQKGDPSRPPAARPPVEE